MTTSAVNIIERVIQKGREDGHNSGKIAADCVLAVHGTFGKAIEAECESRGIQIRECKAIEQGVMEKLFRGFEP